MKTTNTKRRAMSKIGEQHCRDIMFLIRSNDIRFADDLIGFTNFNSKANLYFYLAVLEERKYIKLPVCNDVACEKLASIREKAKNINNLSHKHIELL